MTTTLFNAHVGPRARALGVIKTAHCDAQGYGPAAPVSGSIPCPKCKGTIKFNVQAGGVGLTSGQCSTAGCLTWRE